MSIKYFICTLQCIYIVPVFIAKQNSRPFYDCCVTTALLRQSNIQDSARKSIEIFQILRDKMTLHSLMMSQANFFLQFKSVVNKSAEMKIVTWPKSNFRLTWAPKVGLGPPPIGGRLLRLCLSSYPLLSYLGLSHRSILTHRFPRFPPRNLCFLVMLAVSSLQRTQPSFWFSSF